jgi:hypothetical protein
MISFLRSLIFFLKLASFTTSVTALGYLLLNPSKYEVCSFIAPTLFPAILFVPAVIPFLDLLGRLPTSFWFLFIRIIPSLYFSSLLIRMGLADYRMEDYVINRGDFFSIRRIWSEEEKLGWVQEQLASTPYTLQSANFDQLVKNSSTLVELKSNYASVLFQLQQPKAQPSRGFGEMVYQFCVDHPFLLVGGTVVVSAMVIGYLIYSRPTPTNLWKENLTMALKLLDETNWKLKETKDFQLELHLQRVHFNEQMSSLSVLANVQQQLQALEELLDRLGKVEVAIPFILQKLRVNREELLPLLNLREVAESSVYTAALLDLLKLISEDEQSVERLKDLLNSPINEYFKRKP